MGISWDWLRPLITAPYVPALGPAHPEAVTGGLFDAVIEIAGTGRFLPHDKDRRWAARKDEQVLTRAIACEPGLTLIPVLSTRRASCVKVHTYSQDPRGALSRAAELGRRLCEQHGAERGRLVWFLPPASEPDPVAACTRIQMRTFSPGDHVPGPAPGVVPLEEVTGPARATFSVFAQKLAADGFAFLDARIREHGGTGPVLTAQRDGTIAGAIGPMEIMPDSRGAAQLLPQYFGVLPAYRGQGLGRSLWRAAMHWGQQHQAAYQLLQTETGGASDRLCRSEGLTDLGLHHHPVNGCRAGASGTRSPDPRSQTGARLAARELRAPADPGDDGPHDLAALAAEVAPALADGLDQQQAAPVLGVLAGFRPRRRQRAGVPDEDHDLRPVADKPHPHGTLPHRMRYLHRVGDQFRDHQLRVLPRRLSAPFP